MGDRGQVLIEDEKVYLYTHWGAADLPEIVQKALAKKQRWDDPEYLARIIFCEMVKGDENGETGYGIGTGIHGDIWRLVKVSCEKKEIQITETHYPDKDFKVRWEGSFEEFIEVADWESLIGE